MTVAGSFDEVGPTRTSQAARTVRFWGAAGLTALGLAAAAFVLITLPVAVEREAGPYPALLVVFPPVALWWGVVVLPRDARLLNRPACRREVVGVVSNVRRPRWRHPLHPVKEQGWLLVADMAAIPVWPHDAKRLQEPMDALIRGSLNMGGRVVLEFGDEVFFPIGPVADLAEVASIDRS